MEKKTSAVAVSNGERVIRNWQAWIRRYVVLTDQQSLAIALWAINSWVYDLFETVPFLQIFAKVKRSGKSTILDELKLLCRGSEQLATTRILTLLRHAAENEGKVTLLVDEAESFSTKNAALGDLRSSVATGYRRGASHLTQRAGKVERFPTFMPWAFASIGNVHDVLRDRTIEIALERGTPERILSEHSQTAEAEASALVDQLHAAFKELGRTVHKDDSAKRAAVEALTGIPQPRTPDVGPAIPVVAADWLEARERQLWTPLVSVAAWLKVSPTFWSELQATSVDLSRVKLNPAAKYHSQAAEHEAHEGDMAEKLLRDLRASCRESEEYIVTSDAVARLRALPIGPWRMYPTGGLNEQTLANMLQRFGVKWEQKRLKRTAKGVEGARVQVYSVKALRAIVL